MSMVMVVEMEQKKFSNLFRLHSFTKKEKKSELNPIHNFLLATV